jgi:hypothetical protein
MMQKFHDDQQNKGPPTNMGNHSLANEHTGLVPNNEDYASAYMDGNKPTTCDLI